MVLQSYALYPSMNVRLKNMIFGLKQAKTLFGKNTRTFRKSYKISLQVDQLLV